MDPKVVEKCQQWLIDRKKHIHEYSDRTQNKHTSLDDEIGELSTFDNHPGDMGTELFERQKDLTLYQHEEVELKEIDQALEAIEKGTYHLCDKCGKTIQEERLLAIPATRYCIDHA